jgi:glycine/D-amino acid oxidase-like deaminating enzyme
VSAAVDVRVMGAGIFGLSIAYACARRGARVAVVDPAGPGAGASGGLVGALAPHVPEGWNPKKQFQFESLAMAPEWWAGVEAVAGHSAGYARSGRLQPVADAAALDLAGERGMAARALWRDIAVWQIEPAPAGDWAPVSPTGMVIRDTLSARVHPRAAVAALVAAVRALGGRIGTEAAGAGGPVVWATGHAGLSDLSAATGRAVGTGVKGQAALLALDRRDAPQIFADGVHVVPHADGTVAIGSTSERAFADPAATDGQLDALLARAVAVCPALAGAPVIDRWAGVRPRARSRSPMLGPWPGRAGHLVANGGFKIGFGIAPKVAEVMADLVLEGRDTIPDGFRVEDNL